MKRIVSHPAAITGFMTFLVLAFGPVAAAQAGAPPGADSCVACHGDDGRNADPSVPPLAGQRAGYLRQQLEAFRSGERHDPRMSPAAVELSDARIDALAEWFSTLAPASREPGGPELDPASRPLVFCVRCHGADGYSPNDLWPSLAGLPVAYMRAQVKAYGTGAREDDMMQMWAGMVEAEQLERILEYFHHRGADEEGQP